MLSFALSRKIINILHRNMELLQLKIFENMKNLSTKELTKIRHRVSQQLQTTWCVSEIPYL